MTDKPRSPICEIITIGTEILLGHIQDTNTTYLARELGQIGISIGYRTSVGDNIEEMIGVLKAAANRCDLVIATGGLGPTLDDLTREAVARLGNVELEYKQDLMEQIERRFKRAGYHMPENNKRQAFLPSGSIPISNPVGTAPAFIFEFYGHPIICLPGVPRELQYLIKNEALPWLKKRYKLGDQVLKTRILKSVGMGESKVDELIGDLMGEGKNPEVGLLASMGEIKVRITARADNEADAVKHIQPIETEVRNRLGINIFGQDEDTLEVVIERLLSEKQKTLAIIESFTGGLAAHRFHQIPSGQLTESMVIPDQKQFARWLERKECFANEEIAAVAALKIKEQSQANIGLAIVGFPEITENLLRVDGHICIIDQEEGHHFPWQMGGDTFNLQLRGTIIGLNSLRLALLRYTDYS
jgi:nicotinamide-nucleotide amidase